MTIFLEIMFANIVLIAAFITIHEIGHWTLGYVAGIPARNMKIRLLTFPQQVVLRDGHEWVSISQYDRYLSALNTWVPSRAGQFLYVVGGFLFETLFVIAICFALTQSGRWLLGAVSAGVSLSMYLVYLFAMDLPQSKRSGRPWGDTSILNQLVPGSGWAIAGLMIAIRTALTVFAMRQ